ncbi:PREDICTED: pEARLI1-like lipid transfer protein 3 [Ipomoea nil]|uniref:pEARLI1-like lipid transfer protein 3 n=1 Tax=Ipomoea nil TaxID=35883 RepID=UPI0009015DFB|nr:PREDICTED: pEARLI1-like lipid transfer protein 3 [Ipomoea nil]
MASNKFQALAILLLSLSLASFSLVISALAPVPPPISPPTNGGGNQPSTTISFTDDSGNHPPISPPSNGGGNQPLVISPPRNGGGNQPPMFSTPSGDGSCNKRPVELDACTDLLKAVSDSEQIPPNDSRRRSCCGFLSGIGVDADAAKCLCFTIQIFLRNIVNVDATVRAAIKLCNRNPPNNAITC